MSTSDDARLAALRARSLASIRTALLPVHEGIKKVSPWWWLGISAAVGFWLAKSRRSAPAVPMADKTADPPSSWWAVPSMVLSVVRFVSQVAPPGTHNAKQP